MISLTLLAVIGLILSVTGLSALFFWKWCELRYEREHSFRSFLHISDGAVLRVYTYLFHVFRVVMKICGKVLYLHLPYALGEAIRSGFRFFYKKWKRVSLLLYGVRPHIHHSSNASKYMKDVIMHKQDIDKNREHGYIPPYRDRY